MTELEQQRLKMGFSQQDLAKRANVSRQTISSIESGSANPTQEVLERLAKVLGSSAAGLARRPDDSVKHEWTLEQRRTVTEALSAIVRQVAHRVLEYTGPMTDNQQSGEHGHASAEIDAHAHREMLAAISQHFDRHLNQRDWVVNLVFEDSSATLSAQGFHPTREQQRDAPVAFIDEIDGTTNVKRTVAATLRGGKPKSAVCIAMKNHEDSGVIECGAIYAFDDDATFAGFLADSHYIATRNGALVGVRECLHQAGDSKCRIVVPNYSNSGHLYCAQLKNAIEADVAKGKCETYGGCRSSTIDVIDIVRNQYDAYVDCRTLWTTDHGRNSVLRVYDVAGVLPIARGAGLKVVLPNGDDFSLRGVAGDAPISVVIGRPLIVEDVIRAIAPIVKSFESGEAVRA